MSATGNIIQAEGLPLGKMSIFTAIRITAAMRPRARPSLPDMDTLHRPSVSGASRGLLLVSTL
jgi:hypothetical protein